MGKMSKKEQRELCERLETYSVDELKAMVLQAEDEYYENFYSKYPQAQTCYIPPSLIYYCVSKLKEHSKIVNEIIKEHHSDVATMVYSIGLVVGNQLIQTGTINSMTVVYTILMYFAKIGFDKFLNDSE